MHATVTPGSFDTKETSAYVFQLDFSDDRPGFVSDRPSRRPGGTTVAIACCDGSWWVDWDGLSAMREINNETLLTSMHAAYVNVLIDLLFAARGHGLKEVTRERAHELAREHGKHIVSNDMVET